MTDSNARVRRSESHKRDHYRAVLAHIPRSVHFCRLEYCRRNPALILYEEEHHGHAAEQRRQNKRPQRIDEVKGVVRAVQRQHKARVRNHKRAELDHKVRVFVFKLHFRERERRHSRNKHANGNRRDFDDQGIENAAEEIVALPENFGVIAPLRTFGEDPERERVDFVRVFEA